MADFKIDIKIDDKILKIDLKRAVKKSLFDSGNLIRRRASIKAPFKRGTLRSSIDIVEKPGQVAIGSGLVYAPIQEFGGRTGRNGSVYIRPRRYLRGALEESGNDIERIWIDNIAKEILDLIG